LYQKIKYLGPKYDDGKKKVFLESGLFVFPTKNDIWGNVLLEAMQYGLPIVATNEGAIPEIVTNGETGYVVPKSSPRDLADKIQLLLENPELRRKMGEAGRIKYQENYTLQHFESSLKNAFDNILRRGNPKNNYEPTHPAAQIRQNGNSGSAFPCLEQRHHTGAQPLFSDQCRHRRQNSL
jgi:glycosyltransferase involved in cell wall biosynthesis